MKQMQKDLLKELNITNDENEEDTEEETYEDCINNVEHLDDQINNLQLEPEIFKKEEFAILTHTKEVIKNDEPLKEISTAIYSKKQNNSDNELNNEDALCDLSNAEDEVAHINDYDDIQSIRSVSTAATIAPEVIKRRVKLTLANREKKSQSKRLLVKGEASAVTRTRRENRDAIKDLTGIWGLE